jgi:hypothetical protein
VVALEGLKAVPTNTARPGHGWGEWNCDSHLIQDLH